MVSRCVLDSHVDGTSQLVIHVLAFWMTSTCGAIQGTKHLVVAVQEAIHLPKEVKDQMHGLQVGVK